MNYHFSYFRPKLGDLLLQEPALSKLGQAGTTHLSIKEDRFKILFNNHPHIKIIDDQNGIELSPEVAFEYATQQRKYFSEGYAQQIGVDLERDYFWNFSLLKNIGGNRDVDIVLAPFSCAEHGNPDVSWWNNLIDQLEGVNIWSVGFDEPELKCNNLRNKCITKTIQLLERSKLLISVETGILHLAGMCSTNVIYLSSASLPVVCLPPANRCRTVVLRSTDPHHWDQSLIVKSAITILKKN